MVAHIVNIFHTSFQHTPGIGQLDKIGQCKRISNLIYEVWFVVEQFVSLGLDWCLIHLILHSSKKVRKNPNLFKYSVFNHTAMKKNCGTSTI